MKCEKVIKQLIVTLAIINMLMTYGFQQSVWAAETTATILPGPLTIDNPVKQIEMTYDKETSVFYGEVGTLVVTDATGSGRGWHVNVSASPVFLTQDNGETVQLPEGSLTLHKGGAKISSNGGKLPHFPKNTYIAIDTSKPVKVLTAYMDEGMGKFHIDFAPRSLQLHVPNHEKGDSYNATITFSVTQGP